MTRNQWHIDTEFKHLSPGLPPEEYALLERDIRSSGCRSPLLVWNDLIVDGHLRYDICQRYGIPFQVSRLTFAAREDAVLWICQRHLEKSGLPGMLRRYLIGRLFTAGKDIAYRERARLCVPSASPGPRTLTGAGLGEIYGMSMHTVYKAGTLAAAIDGIRSREPELAKQILSGQLLISYENVSVLARLPREQLRRLTRRLADSRETRLTLSDLKTDPPAKRLMQPSACTASKTPDQIAASGTKRQRGRPRKSAPSAPGTAVPAAVHTSVKEMPPYDPDAAVLSLGYTIPSWIGSIGRTFAQTDLAAVSPGVLDKIIQKLRELSDAADDMRRSAEDFLHDAQRNPGDALRRPAVDFPHDAP